MDKLIHPTIEAITAEESEWRMVTFIERGNTEAIVEVGRLALGDAFYYTKALKNSGNIDDIAKLEELKPKQISQEQALRRREILEPSWSRRPVLRAIVADLYDMSFFGETDDGGLFGYQEFEDPKHPDQCCSIHIEPDGAINVKIDDPYYFIDTENDIDWHTYKLPRKSHEVEHEIHLKTIPMPIVKRIIGSSMIVSQVHQWMSFVESTIEEAA